MITTWRTFEKWAMRIRVESTIVKSNNRMFDSKSISKNFVINNVYKNIRNDVIGY